MDGETFFIGATLLLIVFLFGGVMGTYIPMWDINNSTTTTYTLEDGTVLHNCYQSTDNQQCGVTLSKCDNSTTEYACQNNVKITTDAKDKCGAN